MILTPPPDSVIFVCGSNRHWFGSQSIENIRRDARSLTRWVEITK